MHKIVLSSKFSRERFKRIVDQAPEGYVAEVREPKRTLDQNDKMWAILTEISLACPGGRRLIPDDWKAVLMHSCGWEVQFLEGLDGRPFPRGLSTSKMTKSQMSDFIEYITAFAAEQGIELKEIAA